MQTIAILIPITSRKLVTTLTCWDNLDTLFHSFAETTSMPHKRTWTFNLYFGIDHDDSELAGSFAEIQALVDSHLVPAGIKYKVHFRLFHYPAGSICAIWRDLAFDAYNQGADFVTRLGDDVQILSPNWADEIYQAFEVIAQESKLPFGFGCAAFYDELFPSFPTLPVLHRTHFDIFHGELFPISFMNQDAPPYLFDLYFAWKCARLVPTAKMLNRVGGSNQTRYVKRGVPDWPLLLPPAIDTMSQWLSKHEHTKSLVPEIITIDIVVPTYRAIFDNLKAILELPVPQQARLRVIIVFDNPKATQVFYELEEAYKTNAGVRLRMNETNLGASRTRNRGLQECTGKYVLFLDDDVELDKDILFHYVDCILANPQAAGFVGRTILPPPKTPRQCGVIGSGCTYFWDIANHAKPDALVPWGITANLCMKRAHGLHFHTDFFPKNGGGEDIDFCIRVCEYWQQSGFVSAPKAIARHPWWNGGHPNLSHFSGWGFGDGALGDMNPAWAFYSLPNLCEQLLLLMVVELLLFGFSNPLHAVLSVAVMLGIETMIEFFLLGKLANGNGLQHRMESAMSVVAVRLATEWGWMNGQLQRGRFLANRCKRFNWFGTYWEEWKQVERRDAMYRTAIRWCGLVLMGWMFESLK